MGSTKRMGFGSSITGLAKKLAGPKFDVANFTLFSSVKVLYLMAFDVMGFFVVTDGDSRSNSIFLCVFN